MDLRYFFSFAAGICFSNDGSCATMWGMKCQLCPINCNVDRSITKGACKCGQLPVVARVSRHMWEEPCISGTNGSGTVFFSGCNLNCRFCQNREISRTGKGVPLTVSQLADVFLSVSESGVHNINLVTPQQFSDVIAQALEKVKHKLRVPVVYNTNSYEKVEALQRLCGLVDVYLPDLKFFSAELARNYCGRSDYFDVATRAITEMRRQQPVNRYDEQGIIARGVVLRHLVLPSSVEDSKLVLDWIAQFDKSMSVSLMAQYFPPHHDDKYPQLNRRLTVREYNNIREYFTNVGLTEGYEQDPRSATADYVPDFDVENIQQLYENLKKL